MRNLLGGITGVHRPQVVDYYNSNGGYTMEEIAIKLILRLCLLVCDA